MLCCSSSSPLDSSNSLRIWSKSYTIPIQPRMRLFMLGRDFGGSNQRGIIKLFCQGSEFVGDRKGFEICQDVQNPIVLHGIDSLLSG